MSRRAVSRLVCYTWVVPCDVAPARREGGFRPIVSTTTSCIRVERVHAKLTQADYDRLCAILGCVTPIGFKVGKGRVPRSPTSQAALGRMFGISQQRVSKIRADFLAGRSNRRHACRAMHVTSEGRFVRGAVVAPATSGQPPIMSPKPGTRVAAMAEAFAFKHCL